jgi:hypothetical protein
LRQTACGAVNVGGNKFFILIMVVLMVRGGFKSGVEALGDWMQRMEQKVDALETMVEKFKSTNTQIMPFANCSRCYWHNRCVCEFGGEICRLRCEPRTA